MTRRPQAMPPEVEREADGAEPSQPQRFIRGDTVMLKSGGPRMTVQTQVTEETVRCVWFDGAREMAEIYDVDMLRPIDMSKPRHAASEYDASEEGRE